MRSLEGRVAWVAGVGDEAGIGEAIALALAALGAGVLVSGTVERKLGECVGLVAHAGGKARHVVADAASSEGASRAMDAAVERFGRLDVAVLCAAAADALADAVTLARSRGVPLLCVVDAAGNEPAGFDATLPTVRVVRGAPAESVAERVLVALPL